MPLPQLIYLTGFMAAGKSTIGFIVANTIGYAFVDLDDMIAEGDGRKVSAIFAQSGEAFFRKQEREALLRTGDLRNTVVALGGGALVTDEAWAALPSGSVVVYLDTTLDVLARRIYYGRSRRPLMLDADGKRLELEALSGRISEIMARRRSQYERADITVRSGDRSIGKTVDAVVAALRRYKG